MKSLRYYFEEVENCAMCGEATSNNKVLGQRLNKSQGLSPKQKSGVTTTVEKCKRCSLIYSNPQPTPFDIQDHYGVPPESYWKEEYFTYDPNYFSYEISLAKKLLDFQEGMKALDIGAGLGKGMTSLEKSGFDTYGLEPSIPFREKAISKLGINPDRLKLGMIEELNYPENYFDFVTFGAVLEHLYNPSDCLAKALKWLKPNGVIQVEVPSSGWLISRIFNFYYKVAGTNYVTNLSPMHEPFHMYEFDIKSFQELSKELNFEIAFHEYYVCSIYHVPEILHPVLRWYMKRSKTGMQLAVWLRKENCSL